jgi:hypothetical protein
MKKRKGSLPSASFSCIQLLPNQAD